MRFELPPDPKPEEVSSDLYGTPLAPEIEGTNLLGLPVFTRVEFPATSFRDKVVLDDPIVEVGRDKLIIATDIQGRDGTVKEYISNGDYAVTIKGILASDPKDGRYSRRYPTREVQNLQALIDAAEALPVTGRLFRILGIRNLVIKGHTWPALPGFTNLQAYELRCLSDEPIELSTGPSVERLAARRVTLNTAS
ncbi:DUF6046 domain-containing protein [Hymenobacter cavernae]|nr:DUF6046 domain-containing protein [Hymenobacter cavernae]